MEENNQIENSGNKKWLIVVVAAVVILVITGGFFYFTGTGNVVITEKADVMKDVGKLRILSADEPPANYYSESGEFIGLTVDIMEEIKKYLNLDIETEVMPWARSYKVAQEEPNVILFTASKTQDRIDQGFNFVGPATTRKYILWARKGSDYNIDSIEDIKNQHLKIGTMRGDWREKYFEDLGFDVHNEVDHKMNFINLLEGNIDLWALSDLEVPFDAKREGASMDDIEIAFVFREASSYIMFSEGTSEEIIEEWRGAFEEIQETDFFDIASEKWSEILGMDMGYANEKGFFIK